MLTSCNQGALGSLLIKLNVRFAVYRRKSALFHWPVLEVVGASATTAAISYLVSLFSVNKHCTTQLASVGRFPQVQTNHLFPWLLTVTAVSAILGSNLLNSLRICSWNVNRRDPITTGSASVSTRNACSW